VPATFPQTMNPPRDITVSAVDLVIASDPAEARVLQDQVEQLLQARKVPDKDVFCIKLALEEALVNAIKHGNQLDRSKKVYVSYRLHADRFEIAVRDDGSGFDPSDVPDPTAVENLERPCGRGLMLMRHYMSEVAYNPCGNGVTMCRVFRTNGRK
jgi:serine/threonine-protein kinase RsbW